MSQEKEVDPETKTTTCLSEESKGPADEDGSPIKVGDTVYFNTVDKGTILGRESDGRMRIESYDVRSTEECPWKIIWLIPPGLLKKEKPKDDMPKIISGCSANQGNCNC